MRRSHLCSVVVGCGIRSLWAVYLSIELRVCLMNIDLDVLFSGLNGFVVKLSVKKSGSSHISLQAGSRQFESARACLCLEQ